jgi:hypothetical protein
LSKELIFFRAYCFSSIAAIKNKANILSFGIVSCFSIAYPIYAENDSLKLNEDYKLMEYTALYVTTFVVGKQTFQNKNTIYFIWDNRCFFQPCSL